MKKWASYQRAIEDNLTIIDKDKNEVPFKLNKPQFDFIQKSGDRNVILKARKMGFSSLLLAIGLIKFLYGKNERIVSMSFDKDASAKQLERAKHFLKSYDYINKTNIMKSLKGNSRSEMILEVTPPDGNRYTNTLRIGTARSSGFGRGDDITFLHLTEVSAKDTNIELLLAGVGEAVVKNTMITMETTANGFNGFKTFWDQATLGERGYQTFFYPPNWEYDEAYLEQRKKELGRLFPQEYPMTPEEAFLTSGDMYFDRDALANYIKNAKEPARV